MDSAPIGQSASYMCSPGCFAPQHHPGSASRSPFEGDAHDRALIASIADRNQSAFRELHARYFHRITRFVRAATYRSVRTATHRSDLVDEVANDTLCVVWQCAARFRGESKVSTWIMGITQNLSSNAIRAMRRSYSNVSDALAEQAYEPWSQTELTEWVDEALALLPSEQRTVLEMFYGLDQSCEEISQALNCPLGTVKTRMFHGRRKLRELLPRLAGNTIDDRPGRSYTVTKNSKVVGRLNRKSGGNDGDGSMTWRDDGIALITSRIANAQTFVFSAGQ